MWLHCDSGDSGSYKMSEHVRAIFVYNREIERISVIRWEADSILNRLPTAAWTMAQIKVPTHTLTKSAAIRLGSEGLDSFPLLALAKCTSKNEFPTLTTEFIRLETYQRAIWVRNIYKLFAMFCEQYIWTWCHTHQRSQRSPATLIHFAGISEHHQLPLTFWVTKTLKRSPYWLTDVCKPSSAGWNAVRPLRIVRNVWSSILTTCSAGTTNKRLKRERV